MRNQLQVVDHVPVLPFPGGATLDLEGVHTLDKRVNAPPHPSREDPSLAVSPALVEAGDMVDDPKPAHLGADGFENAPTETVFVGYGFELGQKLTLGPFELNEDGDEDTLLIATAWEEQASYLVQVMASHDPIMVQIHLCADSHLHPGLLWRNQAFRYRTRGLLSVKKVSVSPGLEEDRMVPPQEPRQTVRLVRITPAPRSPEHETVPSGPILEASRRRANRFTIVDQRTTPSFLLFLVVSQVRCRRSPGIGQDGLLKGQSRLTSSSGQASALCRPFRANQAYHPLEMMRVDVHTRSLQRTEYGLR